MKFINKLVFGLVAIVGLMLSAAPAQAQPDMFRMTELLQIAAPAPWATTAGINTLTNGPVDIIGYNGRGTLYLLASTNAGGTLTAAIQTSPDTTNWTALNNYALISSTTSRSITNGIYGGTNLFVTDSYLLPYSPTTPTAYSAGWATPYGNYNSGVLAFTNTAATITPLPNGIYPVGVNFTDNNRYFRIIWTGTGAATNGQTVVGGFISAPRSYTPY